ncbi:hypothetical protein [Candidatus Lokiarchaeum ossiferum]|uniref:hypothetical protein n=1 Tax=Candidatus Lokiarchaeum ossiferum TaxID=2951803 RepID=UPI00352D707E
MIRTLSLLLKSTVSFLLSLYQELRSEELDVSEAPLPIVSEWIKNTGYYAE